MKTLMAVVAFATVFAAPVFAQSVHVWGWKGALAAPASAKSAYAASFNRQRRALPGRTVLSSRIYARDCNVSPASPSYRTNCN
jgi:hypothetical protein